MKIKHQELEIPQDSPFQHCKLDRKKYALILTDIVNTYSDGFVLAINNEWGTGKTTFVKMWQQYLNIESFQTVYFNAWENDFDSNPLVPIMSELKTLSNSNNKTLFKSVVEKGAVLVKNVVPALAKSLLKKYVVDIDDVTIDTLENTTKGATEILEEEIKEYTNKKKTITEFRKELEKFIKKTDSDKPLVFIIDELDRCRPTYAVEVLEQLKHFFSVTGIVFVLSIDKNHLASAVRGFYGSEQINTDEYLRRFIDLEYSIPKPSEKVYITYLFDYYNFNDFFKLPERSHPELQNDADSLLKMAEVLFTKANTTLRQQEKIFGLTRLILKTFPPSSYTISHILFFLIYLKVMRKDLFIKIELCEFSLQELSDMFTDFVPLDAKSLYSINLIYIEAILLHFYNNDLESERKISQLFKTDHNSKLVTEIKSKLDINKSEGSSLASCLADIPRRQYGRMNLTHLLNKINLTIPLITNQ
jgi:hypothetical protein